MTDRDLTALRRASEAEPTDAGKRAALEQAWLRAGLGWHGEQLPGDSVRDPWFVLPDSERGVYRFATQGNVIKLVYVPGGDVACERCEGSAHTLTHVGKSITCRECQGTGRVKIAPLLIGRFPVTWGEYMAFCATSGHDYPHPDGVQTNADRRLETCDLHPVVNVTHADAQAFCSWAGLRLPTAQEWAWAALGGPMVGKRGDVPCPGSVEGDADHELCSRCGGSRRIHPLLERPSFPWGNEPPTPERCAAADPRYQGRSTAPVVVSGPGETRCRDCGEVITRPVGGQHTNGPVRCSNYAKGCGSHVGYKPGPLVPARPGGASWCGAHDLVGNVWQWLSGVNHGAGGSFRTGPDTDSGMASSDDVGFRVALSAAP